MEEGREKEGRERMSGTRSVRVPGGWRRVMKAARGLLDQVTVEPAYMLFALGVSLISVQTTNLQIEKVCKVGGYFLGNGTTYEDEVGPCFHACLMCRSVTTLQMDHFRINRRLSRKLLQMWICTPTS